MIILVINTTISLKIYIKIHTIFVSLFWFKFKLLLLLTVLSLIPTELLKNISTLNNSIFAAGSIFIFGGSVPLSLFPWIFSGLIDFAISTFFPLHFP